MREVKLVTIINWNDFWKVAQFISIIAKKIVKSFKKTVVDIVILILLDILKEVFFLKSNLEFRFAEINDTAKILYFIKELALYEKMLDEVVATEDQLKEWIFEKKKAEVIFAIENGKEIGFALFFHNFSTFLGRSGIYLEDLFILQEHRGKGYGKSILKYLAQIAVERGCGRLEWWCLDWNKASIEFYLSLGAKPMNDWTVYRITGDTLVNMAK